MHFPLVGKNSNASSGGQSCYENNKLSIYLMLAGIILISGGIVSMYFAGQFPPLHIIGSISTTIGTSFLGYSLFCTIYNQCVKNEPKIEPINNPNKPKKNETNPIPIPTQKESQRDPKVPVEVHYSFDQKMHSVYPKYADAQTENLSHPAKDLKYSAVSEGGAKKGVDSQNCRYLAVRKSRKELWVFVEDLPGAKATTLWKIEGKRSKSSSVFKSETLLNEVKTALQ